MIANGAFSYNKMQNIKTGKRLSPNASFPAMAPISSTSIKETLLSLTPHLLIIQSVVFPIFLAMSAAVSILGGRYNPTPVILTFNARYFKRFL